MNLSILQKKNFFSFVLLSLIQGIQNLLFPPHCLSCQEGITSPLPQLLCSKCQEALLSNDDPLCARCGKRGHFLHAVCKACRGRPRPLFRLFVVLTNNRPASCLLKELSKKNQLATSLASIIFIHLVHQELSIPDLLIPIPSGSLLKKKNGPSLLLAKELAHLMDRPYLDTLVPTKNRFRQRFKSHASRAEVSEPFFFIDDEKSILNQNILLVDDAIKTGETVNQAALLLLKKGAKSVSAVVFKRE